MQSRNLLGVAAFLILQGAGAVAAQPFPSRPITIVAPSGPAAALDIISRLVASKLEPRLGQRVLVENRVGAGGYLGGEYVARANPDGHTLVLQNFGGLHGDIFVKGQALVLPSELVPVVAVAEAPYMFITSAEVPAKDLKEFVALVRANPKKYNAAVFPGTAVHLETLAFMKAQGMDMLPVPYNSTDAIRTALLRNDVQLTLTAPGGWLPQVEAGKLKVLAITDRSRLPQLPNVPSTKEQGFDFTSSGYYALFAPPKTPKQITDLLQANVSAVMDAEDVRRTLAANGFRPPARATPAELSARLAAYTRYLHETAREAGIVPQ